jgi:hypothetical protein
MPLLAWIIRDRMAGFLARWTPNASWPRRRAALMTLGGVVTCLVLCMPAVAQNCKPVSQRTGELGCWITATTPLGPLPEQPIFWHLDTFPTRAAAEAAKGPRGTVVESLGKVWLFTIDVAEWRPPGGERVADIGPLPVSAGVSYVSEYMEAVFTPGMTAPVHRHPGPEAWYTLSGETCLETPEGKMVGRAGGARAHPA